MDGLRPCRFKRGTCRAVWHHRRSQEQASPGRIGRKKVKRPTARRHLTAGLRPGREKRSAALAARCSSTAEVRHGLSVPTGKPAGMAASGHPCGALRPGQITPGRQVGRPLSPARVRAMPEPFVVIERPQKPFSKKKGVPCPRLRPVAAAGGPPRRFLDLSHTEGAARAEAA